MRKVDLSEYTLGLDGIYRKVQHFGTKTVVLMRNPAGEMVGVQHIEADVAGNVRATLTFDTRYEENMA